MLRRLGSDAAATPTHPTPLTRRRLWRHVAAAPPHPVAFGAFFYWRRSAYGARTQRSPTALCSGAATKPPPTRRRRFLAPTARRRGVAPPKRSKPNASHTTHSPCTSPSHKAQVKFRRITAGTCRSPGATFRLCRRRRWATAAAVPPTMPAPSPPTAVHCKCRPDHQPKNACVATQSRKRSHKRRRRRRRRLIAI